MKHPQVDRRDTCKKGTDTIDPDIKADVDRELGNEAFRLKVIPYACGVELTRRECVCTHSLTSLTRSRTSVYFA